jgi:biopolymer transport protein ExbB/TolQ
MPGWQIALIAAAAALFAAIVAVLLDRALAARRHGAVTWIASPLTMPSRIAIGIIRKMRKAVLSRLRGRAG